MKVLSEREQIRTVASRWKQQYGSDYWSKQEDKQAVGKALSALDVETATADDVSKIIGNSSWVEVEACDECGMKTWDVVQMGEEPDYESSTATICTGCLRTALRLLGAA